MIELVACARALAFLLLQVSMLYTCIMQANFQKMPFQPQRKSFQGTARLDPLLKDAVEELERQLDDSKIRAAMTKIKNKAGAHRAYDAAEHSDNLVKTFSMHLPGDDSCIITIRPHNFCLILCVQQSSRLYRRSSSVT